MGGTQGEGAFDVEFGEFPAELPKGVVVADVFAQVIRLGGGHAAGAVGSVAPDLQLEIGTEPGGLAVLANGALAVFLGEGSGLHVGDGGDAVDDLLAKLPGGRFWYALHGGAIMTMRIDIIKGKKIAGWKTYLTFLSCTLRKPRKPILLSFPTAIH